MREGWLCEREGSIERKSALILLPYEAVDAGHTTAG